MKLANLLSADQIILDMKAVEHWPAITELVDHLVEIQHLPEDQREDVLGALKAREEQVSTGIGSGVAIPHAFSNDIEEVITIDRLDPSMVMVFEGEPAGSAGPREVAAIAWDFESINAAYRHYASTTTRVL